MNSAKKPVLLVLAFLLLIASFTSASTPQPPAMPRDYVTDLAGIMTPAVTQKLNGLLQELERKTSSQVLVLTVQTLDGQSIEEFSLDTKEKWKLGQKGKDNGVLIVVAVKDRRYRFEVGYGLESILPDSMVGTLGRQYLVPYFKQGDYGTGVYAAALAIANVIASDAGVEISGMPRLPGPQTSGNGNGAPNVKMNPFVLGLLVFVALILFITHPKQCFLLLLMSSMGGRGGGWSGGGGGFGGGGGSFGGGGGGSGGGGGASGSW